MGSHNLIIPVAELAATMRNASAPIFQSYQLEVPSEYTWERIVREMVMDIVHHRVRWQEGVSDGMNYTLARAFSWYRVGDEFSDHWYQRCIDNTESRLNALISTTIPMGTWDKWSIERIGADVVLINQGDFRILDWEKRMQTNNWPNVSEPVRGDSLLDEINSTLDGTRPNHIPQPIHTRVADPAPTMVRMFEEQQVSELNNSIVERDTNG